MFQLRNYSCKVFSFKVSSSLSLLKTLPFASQASPRGQTSLLVLYCSGQREEEGQEIEQEQQLRNTDYWLNWAEGKRGTASSVVCANILPISSVCVGRKSGPSPHPFSAFPSVVPEAQAQSYWQGQACVGEMTFSATYFVPGQPCLSLLKPGSKHICSFL